jgi:hypothetical protein
VDPDDLARANQNLFADSAQYKGIFSDDTDPMEVTIPAGSLVTLPGSSLLDSLTEGFEETFMPFGAIESPAGVLKAFTPAMYHHIFRGLGLGATPADQAFAGDLDSIPIFNEKVDKAAINSQILEAFYYLESTEGAFSKIFELQERKERLVAKGGSEEADEVMAEITALTDQAIKRALDMAGGSMILRGMAGSLFPNTGRVLRQEITAIDAYWDTREFAEQLRGNDADGKPMVTVPLTRLKKPEDIDAFFEQVGVWLDDPTGDDSRAWVRENHPEIFAYLQPKTFWGEAGVPPEISSYEDYLDQIRSGERKPVPLDVAVQRHLHAGIESDYWIDFVNNFGNDPEEAVSRALDNYHIYSELQDERYGAKDALFVSDDLHGADYLDWLESRSSDDDTYASTEEALDRVRDNYDALQDILDFEADSTMTAAEVREHRKIIKTTLARFSEVIDELEGPKDPSENAWKNPYELAMNEYWTTIYAEYEKSTDSIWDAIGESKDTEEKSLLFENLKMAVNDWAGTRHTMFGREDITYPSPLDVKWQRKTDDEKRAFVLKQSTKPLEWLNLDDVERIMSFAPADAASFFPKDRQQMEIYTRWTVAKNEIEEMSEKGLITESERRKMQDEAEASVHSYLMESGREDELTYMNLWPIEKLHVLNLLPEELSAYMPQVRFIKETLAAEGRGPRSKVGDQLLIPLYTEMQNRAYAEPAFGTMLEDLGLTLFDEGSYDGIPPKLIVGYFEADF